MTKFGWGTWASAKKKKKNKREREREREREKKKKKHKKKKKKKKKKEDQILAHDLGLTPQSVQVHGLGLRAGINARVTQPNTCPKNRFAWFMT